MCDWVWVVQPKDESIWKWEVDDFINAIPPFWSQGVVENYGARWGGQVGVHTSEASLYSCTDSQHCVCLVAIIITDYHNRQSSL